MVLQLIVISYVQNYVQAQKADRDRQLKSRAARILCWVWTFV